MGKLLIIVDSREQLAYWKGSECFKTCLNVGDYTTVKLLNKVHIERKSPQDLYQTITKGCYRFKEEVLRAHNAKIKLVVYVESTRVNFINKKFPRGSERKITTEALDKTITTFETKYFLEFVWCGDRNRAKEMVLKRLKQEERGR
jgi:ERCC4-type nuclease